MFVWVGAVGLAPGAFCQTYVRFYVVLPPGLTPAQETVPTSINEHGEIAGYYTFGSGNISTDLCAPPTELYPICLSAYS
jgi:hypothetical protein